THDLGRQFHFAGPTGSIVDELRKADWLVHPSTNEPCSVALQEALALGLPVVVSQSGGSVGFFQPGRKGVVFKPDDSDDLARQLGRILRGEVSVLAPADIRETVRDRSASGVLPCYQEFYRRVLASKNATAG